MLPLVSHQGRPVRSERWKLDQRVSSYVKLCSSVSSRSWVVPEGGHSVIMHVAWFTVGFTLLCHQFSSKGKRSGVRFVDVLPSVYPFAFVVCARESSCSKGLVHKVAAVDNKGVWRCPVQWRRTSALHFVLAITWPERWVTRTQTFVSLCPLLGGAVGHIKPVKTSTFLVYCWPS